jgi:hypothetical protein
MFWIKEFAASLLTKKEYAMSVYTNQPAVLIYVGNCFNAIKGKITLIIMQGICFETKISPALEHFPSSV